MGDIHISREKKLVDTRPLRNKNILSTCQKTKQLVEVSKWVLCSVIITFCLIPRFGLSLVDSIVMAFIFVVPFYAFVVFTCHN